MKLRYLAGAVLTALAFSACGGGGGGTGPNNSAPVPSSPLSITGDMLAFSPSRGWNYQGSGLTVSTYVDPDVVGGSNSLSADNVFTGFAVSGSAATALPSSSADESNAIGALALHQTSAGYILDAEISLGSSALIPGSPLFVGSTLTQGQVSTPYPGVTETVQSIGVMPGENACPNPSALGARLTYAVAGNGTYTLTVVPGCGITSFTGASGNSVTLVSVGTYNVGDLSIRRRVQSLTYLDTAKSLVGLSRNTNMAAGSRVSRIIK